jgi:hypothetical protein
MKAQWTLGSWTIPALLAACVFFGAPGPRAATGPPSPRDAPFLLAQADTTAQPGDDEDDEEDIPANLRDNTPPAGFGSKDAAPDTTGAAAARDSTRTSISAEPETLRYEQPGGPPIPGATIGAKPGKPVVPAAPPKPKGALFGLGPTVVILGLAVVHFLVLRAVGG